MQVIVQEEHERGRESAEESIAGLGSKTHSGIQATEERRVTNCTTYILQR